MKSRTIFFCIVILVLIFQNTVYAANLTKVTKQSLQDSLDYVTKEKYEKTETKELEDGGTYTTTRTIDYTNAGFNVTDDEINFLYKPLNLQIPIKYKIDGYNLILTYDYEYKESFSYDEFEEKIRLGENFAVVFYTALAKLYDKDIFEESADFSVNLAFKLIASEGEKDFKYIVVDDEKYDLFKVYYDGDEYTLIKNSEFPQYSKEYLEKYFEAYTNKPLKSDCVEINRTVKEKKTDSYIVETEIKYDLSDFEKNIEKTESKKSDEEEAKKEKIAEIQKQEPKIENIKKELDEENITVIRVGFDDEEENENYTVITTSTDPNDTTVANKKIPNAGVKKILVPGIVIILVICGIYYKKYKNLENI